MSSKIVFNLQSDDHSRPLPKKIVIVNRTAENPEFVLLKLLSFALFFRERLHLDLPLEPDLIPFIPDIVQLDYQLQPALWIECHEAMPQKLKKIATKLPQTEIWIAKPSLEEAQDLLALLEKNKLRPGRYNIVAFPSELINELTQLLEPRNQLFWSSASFLPPNLQFDFNGLWFDSLFQTFHF